MNLIRNNGKLVLLLEKTDLDAGTYQIWTDLEYLLGREKLDQITVSTYDDDLLSMPNLSVLASLGLRLQQTISPVDLEGTSKILTLIQFFNFSGYFSRLIDAD